MTELYKKLLRIKSKYDAYNSLKDFYYDIGEKPNKNTKFKILILNAPCNGFGDVVFAMKIFNYLKEWYPNATIKIATPKVDNFLSLGQNPSNLYYLNPGKGIEQCRRFTHLKFQDIQKRDIDIPIFDLILVAPMQIDFYPSIEDIAKLIPYANNVNTLTFSEYNDYMDKDFDFNTGVGADRDGLLFTFPENIGPLLPTLKNPYAVVYIHDLANSHKCFLSFIELLTHKYAKKHKKLDIVLPIWIIELILEDKSFMKKMLKSSSKYGNIVIKTKKNDNIVLASDDLNNQILTLRGDILPVANKDMLSLYKHSVSDILVTGDQSITDVLSCCWKSKIPHYQIVSWKKDFAKNLAKHLPDKYISEMKSSCGTLQAIRYKPNFKKFIHDWDFRTRAKERLDAYIALVLDIKNDEPIADIYNLIVQSKTYRQILKAL